MEIIRIKKSNLDDFIDDLVTLNDEFLVQLGCPQERAISEKQKILNIMVNDDSPTVLLAAVAADGEAVGFSYYNYGSGYSCGGMYLQLNSIYVKPEHQNKGYGSKVIKYIEADAREKGIKLFISGRHIENEASRKLFAKMGFDQTLQHVTISKTFE